MLDEIIGHGLSLGTGLVLPFSTGRNNHGVKSGGIVGTPLVNTAIQPVGQQSGDLSMDESRPEDDDLMLSR